MSDELTPMMRQYRQVKSQLPQNTILFFRLGDFYEMFFEDAKEAARILDITLTRRQKVPMCGVPYHSADQYLARLIRAGKKVAVCDQVEDPAKAKGIVRREITNIVSPGAVMSETLLDSNRNNYLAGLYETGGVMAAAFLDLSTGEFWGEESGGAEGLRDTLLRFAPSECVMPADQARNDSSPLRRLIDSLPGILVTPYDEWTFEGETAADSLSRHFNTQSLAGFGLDGRAALIGAAGGALHYASVFLRRNLAHVRRLQVRSSADFLVMDEATRANLDLVQSREVPRTSIEAGRGAPGATLLGTLDATCTPMGARKLRDWILRPLIAIDAIRKRLDAVETLVSDRTLLRELRDVFADIRDLERLVARLGTGGNARDMRGLGQSLSALPRVKNLLAGCANPLLRELSDQVSPLPDLAALIERAIVDEPPIPVKEGGIIRRGYHAELDELRDLAAQGRTWLAEYQASEQQRTGIKTLKVRHNSVFGYYIELSRGQAENAPAEYVRKQTLVNAERYITPQLKEYENKIVGAQDRAMAIEYDLFLELRAACAREGEAIQASAGALAAMDVLAAFAERALALRYARPAVTDSARILIRDGRHPVVEQMPGADRFVPNDILLDGGENRLILLTGPNMAGKSTFIRQVAVIVIMAQVGSFVPAASAEIGVVDRVFTRVGASDDLARGRSTFMVEMQETANILNNATARSLVVLDEIGRGTSTFDGISIAWAVAENLHDRIRAKTLFATHYHELTDLALTLKGVRNYNVLVREAGDKIVFLRKIVPGSADKSYGIQVARLAGLPGEVIDRAKEILLNLEEGEFADSGQPKLARHRPRKEAFDKMQLTLFDLSNPPDGKAGKQ